MVHPRNSVLLNQFTAAVAAWGSSYVMTASPLFSPVTLSLYIQIFGARVLLSILMSPMDPKRSARAASVTDFGSPDTYTVSFSPIPPPRTKQANELAADPRLACFPRPLTAPALVFLAPVVSRRLVSSA